MARYAKVTVPEPVTKVTVPEQKTVTAHVAAEREHAVASVGAAGRHGRAAGTA